MLESTVKLGANYERFIQKYEGTSEVDYTEFSKRTARKVVISRFDDDICERFKIYAVSHLAYIQTEVPEGVWMEENDFESFVYENTKNPYEIARIWMKLKTDAENYFDKESVLAEYLGPFPKVDFERWSDKNCVCDVSRSWFKSDAMHIDVKVEELNENPQIPFDFTIQDCIDFVRKYRPNSYKNPVQLQKEALESRFKELTGFYLKEYYAVHLIKSCEFVIVSVLDQTPF